MLRYGPKATVITSSFRKGTGAKNELGKNGFRQKRETGTSSSSSSAFQEEDLVLMLVEKVKIMNCCFKLFLEIP